jgi:NTE family protein
VDTIVSSSIGSVVGSFYAMGMSPTEMMSRFSDLNEGVFKFSDVNGLFTKFGIDTGEYFMAYLIDMMMSIQVNPLITLRQFHEKFKIRLIFTASNLTTHKCDYLTPEDFGDMRLIDALRITTSIPFLFTMVHNKNSCYVDGAVMDNYPMFYCLTDFEKRHSSPPSLTSVIGCNINNHAPRPNRSLEDFLFNLFVTVQRKSCDESFTVSVATVDPSVNFGSVDFNMTEARRRELFSQGYTRTDAHLRRCVPERRRSI